MNWLQALILGLVQGLTEFLPVSSSGHLELGHAILGIENQENLLFDLVVHGGTVLSTIVIFRKDILDLFNGLFSFNWNEETRFVSKLILSAIPVGLVGVFYKEEVEALFGGNLVFVGSMLLVTATLLSFTFFAKNRLKENISYSDSFVIGLAQAFAVLPGVSRSGSTIAIGILLGNNKGRVARFSFLMVLIPILGANLLELLGGDIQGGNVDSFPLIVGFFASFLSGLAACKWMIDIVKRGKLIYFAIYCAIIGLIAIFVG